MIESTSLEGQVILVTGAASGIGKQIAIDLCSRGAKVVASDRNLPALQEISHKHSMSVYEVDFLDEKSIVDLVSKVETEVGPISAVVNCVGILGKNGDPIEFLDIQDFDYVYAVNLRGAVILTKSVIAGMAQRGYGRILHIASISGKEGNPYLVAYSATKAGLIGMVKSVGKEYATTGITINAMAPALIESPMSASFSEQQMAALKSKIPMERLGKGQEVADLAAWIISPACSFTTGFTFDLSGGRATY
jgi:NAD(P)-dependent dehydrogenase (short-subunit alcohol dehydrogenase family)